MSCIGSWVFYHWHHLGSPMNVYDDKEPRKLVFCLSILYLYILNVGVFLNYLLIYFDHARWHVGFYFLNQGLNLCPLQWNWEVSTTGPPGQSHVYMPSIWSFYHMSDKPLSDFMYVILLILSVSPLLNEEPKATYLEILKNTEKKFSMILFRQ